MLRMTGGARAGAGAVSLAQSLLVVVAITTPSSFSGEFKHAYRREENR